jgi:hypothetical protein
VGSWSGGAPQVSRNRFACFDCRKAFKSPDIGGYVSCCPNCKKAVHAMSVYWYPPKKTDIKMWEWSKRFDRCGDGCFKEPTKPKGYEFLPNYKRDKQ